MKKSRGFTLIELLIVTVVIATLMAIVFRLAGTGGESTARAKTLARLQKLSNALSGYYAAFGSYPPVPLQGRSRDIYTQVDSYGAKEEKGRGTGSLGYGIQGSRGDKIPLSEKNIELRKQIEAACRAQPVAAGYPLNSGNRDLKDVVDAIAKQEGAKVLPFLDSYSRLDNRNSSDWSQNNAFMFGLMSFLLPRYQFMLDGYDKDIYGTQYPNSPWMTNNRLPFLLNGKRLLDWETAQKALLMGKYRDDNKTTPSDPELKKLKAMIENLPSQKVCARWMPNFKGIVTSRPTTTVTTFFGVDTEDNGEFGPASSKWFVIGDSGYNNESSFINGIKTVLDGWGEEFYYSSLPPYQSYQLWSSGPNKRTFPPWLEPESGDRDLVNKWIADDIKVGDK